MGSTNLHSNWNPDNATDEEDAKPAAKAHYPTFLKFCRESLRDLQDKLDQENDGDFPATRVRLAGMFWLQGESDSSKSKDAKNYLNNFQSFISALRRDLNTPDLPVVASPVVWKGKHVQKVNEALRQAGNGAVPHCICIDELDTAFGVQPVEAGICADHLTAQGVTDIGRRMGEAFPLERWAG